jgi:tryptophan 2,3-dioxygenase
VKLLRRGIELFRLFDALLFIAEKHAMDLHLTKTLQPAQGLYFSHQLVEILDLAQRLGALPVATGSSFEVTVGECQAALQTFEGRYSRFTKATLFGSETSADSFGSWLELDRLLDLQQGIKADWTEEGTLPSAHVEPDEIGVDENMFIIVHQCFELWFKVILDSIDRSIPLILQNRIAPATFIMRRVVDIQRLLVQQIQIPTTMLPLDFARFRSEKREQEGRVEVRGLSPASGTESFQFREIEIVAGLKDNSTFQAFLNGTERLPTRFLTPRQSERLKQPTLVEGFQGVLQIRGIARLQELFAPSDAPNPNVDLAELADTLVDFDDGFRQWRLGHVSMVEKMIGAKSGTGFLGPEYLMETAGYKLQEKNRIFDEPQVRPRFFEELWAVRSRMGVR